MPYRVLTEFENLFVGEVFRHRSNNQGDFVAMHLYEDLVTLNKSALLVQRVQSREWVVNTENKRVGIKARRGDGAFGEVVPGEVPITDPGYLVSRGKVANIEIGVEVKILAKAMVKQIGRVCSDLRHQVTEFQRGRNNPICVGIVGINEADYYVSYEGDRTYPTDGTSSAPHPRQEADEAERRLLAEAAPAYDAFLILRFAATNADPFPFRWANQARIEQVYGAELVRLSRLYDQRFR